MSKQDHWIGIDYGSKLAGTTAICFVKDDQIQIVQSEKKSDADQFVKEFVTEHKVEDVFLDAPLSLPNALFGNGDDFFYRRCDKETKAMSPMFLGGLTARAMKLKHQLTAVKFYETYPAYLVKVVLELGELYQKKGKFNPDILKSLSKLLPLNLKTEIENWHQLDALLCWISGRRYFSEESLVIGDAKEGVIIV